MKTLDSTCTGSRVHCRWMVRDNMIRVLDIEFDSFEIPWTYDDFFRELSSRNCLAMVAEIAGQVAGYVVYRLHRRYIEIINLAVAPECRRDGVGRAMLDKLRAKLLKRRRNKLVAIVREKNVAGQMFFKACGFEATAIERGYYAGEDAYRFEGRI